MGGIVGLSKTISAGISTGDKVAIQRPVSYTHLTLPTSDLV